MSLFKDIRKSCAVELQRIWRGFSVRLLGYSREDRVILKWKWGALKSDSVYVAGEFSNWQKWRMRACPSNGDHRIVLSPHLLRGRDSFKYKFVVDDLWTCDGSLPMIEDDFGNINNIYHSSLTTGDQTNQVQRESSQIQAISNSQLINKRSSVRLSLKSNPPQLHLNENRLPPPTNI